MQRLGATALNKQGASVIRELKHHYRSGQSDLGRDFFIPCLHLCSRYDRASGFFSSTVLAEWTEILPRVALHEEASIRLLVSPSLSLHDAEAMRTAVDEEHRRRLRQISADLVITEFLEAGGHEARQAKLVLLFAWMVANDRLQLRFAFPSHSVDAHMYHEKFGVFAFPDGDEVAFIGSANETYSGHHANYESIDVYRSWVGEEDLRVRDKEDQFAEAWCGRAPGLVVLEPSPEILDRVRIIAPDQMPAISFDLGLPPQEAEPPDGSIRKWRHQDEAIEAFLAARAGVIEMATGTGKTRVALRIVKRLLDFGQIDNVVVCTSGNDLLEQWFGEILELLGSERLSVLRHYGSHHELNRYLMHPEKSVLLVSRQNLQKLLPRLSNGRRNRTMIVHDEVHGLGSPGNVATIAGGQREFAYKLGLSATPEREYDEEGTEFIREEIGEVVYKFGLEEAIRRGILCEFDYVPLEYDLTESDRERIKKVYAQQAARRHAGQTMSEAEIYRLLADVYKTAEEKPGVFAQYVRANPQVLRHSIIFAHTKEFAQAVVETVHSVTPNYSTYFDDDHRDRLVAFGAGELDCLITCHRISQGIDIRHLENVVLLSADRARLETIQRIGRCLRTDPLNPSKRARIVDLVRSQDATDRLSADQDRHAWLSEVARVEREEDL